MNPEKKDGKIVKLPFRKNINIGIVIFSIILFYLIATIVMYITSPHITAYEVRQGSILKDNAYTGLAIRDETLIYADAAGYVNYYAEDNSKVRVGSRIYTLSDQELFFDENTLDTNITLTEEEIRSLTLRIQAYNNEFNESDFSSTYLLKNELKTTLNKIASHGKTDQLDTFLQNDTAMGLQVKTSTKDGIVVYSMDNLDGITLDTVTSENFKKANYKKTEFKNNTSVASGDPVYKVVTSDNWYLLIEVSEDTKNALANKNQIKVNFKKDSQELYGKISFLENTDTPVLCLNFHDSMIRYVTERFLDVELILEDETGLKIPKTAETSKEFYIVPNTYLTQGGNSSSQGVMRQTKNSNDEIITEFLEVTVYYEEDEMVYLDPNAFEDGDTLLKPNSSETYALIETRSLKGVYCINKGYAVFKQIKILCESDDYYIIEEGNSFGLSNYDHIALNSKGLKENDVVF